MKKTFFVSAIYTSPSGSMGGNTKILLEMINELSSIYNFVIFTTEPDTFLTNVKNTKSLKLISIPYPYKKFSPFTHLSECGYIFNYYFNYFKKNKINKNDLFYSCSDFGPDVLPLAWLKGGFEFKWIPSLYLFIPNPIENLSRGYKFPFLKYIIYYFYQRYIFSNILRFGDYFFVTNEIDKNKFPKKIRRKVLALYGGVNTEQIKKKKRHSVYDAVFCSRLHPQKGVAKLIDSWTKVVKVLPNAKMALIGNGAKGYENYLKKKIKQNNLSKNIEMLGYINGVEKYDIYSKSKIFLHSTVYDNNGMVAAEALCAGLPVVMYDLPYLKKIYRKSCIKAKVGDEEDFAKKIIKLLLSKESYLKYKPNKHIINEYRKEWNWNNLKLKILDLLNE